MVELELGVEKLLGVEKTANAYFGCWAHRSYLRIAFLGTFRELVIIPAQSAAWGSGAARHTFSIVTTEADELMRRIHNNPKAEGPWMPLILNEEEEQWRSPIGTPADEP